VHQPVLAAGHNPECLQCLDTNAKFELCVLENFTNAIEELRERLRESAQHLADIQLRLRELENSIVALKLWPDLSLRMPESLFRVPDEGRPP
jgi:hypothetical protein